MMRKKGRFFHNSWEGVKKGSHSGKIGKNRNAPDRTLDNLVTRLTGIVGDTFKAIGTRLLVHFLGLLWVGSSPDKYPVVWEGSNPSLLSFGIYIGWICLLPGVVRFKADWFIPVCCGFLACATLAAFGMPVFLTLIWGGLQVWLQRFVQKKGRMGWEFSVLPFLSIALAGTGGYWEVGGIWSTIVVTEFVLFLGGSAIYSLYTQYQKKIFYKNMLFESADVFKSTWGQERFSEADKRTLKVLEESATQLALVGRFDKGPECLLAEELDVLAAELVEKQQTKVFSLVGVEPPPEKLVEKLKNCLGKKVLQKKGNQGHVEDTQDIEVLLAPFITSSRQLEKKLTALPDSLQESAGDICLYSFKILDLMRDDPADRAPGERFLVRYLKAAHLLIDEYLRLSAEDSTSPDVLAVLTKSQEVMSRLAQAFKDEHGRLLRNDTLAFSAELSALDTLLSMRGR